MSQQVSDRSAADPTTSPPAQLHPDRHRRTAERARLVVRRRLVLALNLLTIAALTAGMVAILSTGGWVWTETVMLVAYMVTLPWLSIGLWNSLIGFALDRRYGEAAASYVTPALDRVRPDAPVTTRTAIVMPLRNEDPQASLTRLRAVQQELARTPWSAFFEFHVLSDTDRPAIALREETGIAAWRKQVPGVQLSYHRRDKNTGYKAGNIAEFLDRHGARYDFFLPLDADSVMDAETVLRMVRVMQAAPEIGILQSLVTGLPARTLFTRAFQFGMRHGMRAYTLGSAWWQGDCGPNWGHNVLIRTAPFHEHCMLPTLPGRGPLSGDILSHDQVEATLMRRAGYEVRVIAEETGSHEENPPSLADFIRRELRWCNGNMQYLHLLRTPGLKPVSRIQLYLAIQMYLAAPAWMLFIGMGALLAAQPAQIEGVPLWVGLAFFGLLMTLNLMPKLMGLAQILASSERAEAYGGRARVAVSGLAEILLSMLTAPIVAFGLTLFTIGLLMGKRVGWDAQQRSRARLGWGEAARVLWPQTLVGLGLLVWLGLHAPWAVAFGAPVLLALIAAIPIAVLTTLPRLSAASINNGLFDVPEERHAGSQDPKFTLHVDIA
ncbi:glucans biosynthesis glucosyltransferase MdoH [uncultured Roseobacter sp.]|uniref:glucans biosynthesis glucosyltransferase MdoH n=1 Tax=uncultured Roseobacter sp. TaxID=114847 RepID=UPI00261A3624|nr:glucans biosynthesis glucosyltransferase MdoH [uncultured Roseobacter sp.]